MILLVLLLYVAFLCVSLSPSTSLLYSPPISLRGGGQQHLSLFLIYH